MYLGKKILLDLAKWPRNKNRVQYPSVKMHIFTKISGHSGVSLRHTCNKKTKRHVGGRNPLALLLNSAGATNRKGIASKQQKSPFIDRREHHFRMSIFCTRIFIFRVFKF